MQTIHRRDFRQRTAGRTLNPKQLELLLWLFCPLLNLCSQIKRPRLRGRKSDPFTARILEAKKTASYKQVARTFMAEERDIYIQKATAEGVSEIDANRNADNRFNNRWLRAFVKKSQDAVRYHRVREKLNGQLPVLRKISSLNFRASIAPADRLKVVKRPSAILLNTRNNNYGEKRQSD